jgi:hypothetical protein
MSGIAQVQELMEQLGPQSPELGHVTQVADTAWYVGMEERMDILLELDADGAQLVLTAPLGQVAPDATSLQEMFLGYNALWRDTGGVRLAVADGEAMQLLAVEASGLDVATLRRILDNFAEKARVWQRMVESGAQVQGADLAPAGLLV